MPQSTETTTTKPATSAPQPAVFLTAEWRYLVMVNYEVDPRVVADLTPPGVELDYFNGRTFVSLVGFLFLDTKLRGWAIPFHRNFEELNLRFYVVRRTGDGVRRGVAFVKELVPRSAIAWTAWWLYNENYFAVPMRHLIEHSEGEPPKVEYGWGKDARESLLRVEAEGDSRPLAPGSEEQFIAEHYWGYSTARNGGAWEYQVEHPPWRVWDCRSLELDCDVAKLYGDRYAETLAREPSSVFLADGSAISVRKPVWLR